MVDGMDEQHRLWTRLPTQLGKIYANISLPMRCGQAHLTSANALVILAARWLMNCFGTSRVEKLGFQWFHYDLLLVLYSEH